MKLPMALGLSHHDDPPPDVLESLDDLREEDRFRFANELRAWIDVEDGAVIGAGYSGGGHIGATTLAIGRRSLTIAAVAFPDIQHDPEIEDGRAIFRQTAGGRTGAPMPRRVNRPPFLQITAPTAWTTLELTVAADGSSGFALVGASPFPRHWIYDHEGRLTEKSGVIDYTKWSQEHFGDHTPWGDVDSETLVTTVETALERDLSMTIMHGGERPEIRRLQPGDRLTEQGASGGELFLLLDGVVSVEVDGEVLTEVGPGAVMGERALLEGGQRTATLTAVTPAKVAVAAPGQVDMQSLRRLAEAHRREDT